MPKYIALSPIKMYSTADSIPLLDTFNCNYDGNVIGEYVTTRVLDNKQIIEPFYNQSLEIANTIIASASCRLYQKCKLKLSDNAWKKILFIWSWNLVIYCYYGYTYIKEGIKKYPNCIFITDQNYLPYIEDSNDFFAKRCDNAFNLHIYSDIVRCLALNHVDVQLQKSEIRNCVYWGNKGSLKRDIMFNIFSLFGGIFNKPIHILENCYGVYPSETLRKGAYRLSQQKNYGKKFILNSLDCNFRMQKLGIPTNNDEFLNIIDSIALRYLPVSCCEELNNIYSYANHISPNSKGVLATSLSCFTNPVFIGMAITSERPMVVIEHGGANLYRNGVGITIGHNVSDRYYSYSNMTDFSLPSPYLAEKRKRKYLRRPTLVGTAIRHYYNNSFDSQASITMHAYLTERINFFKGLQDDKFPEVRLFFSHMLNERVLLDRQFKGIIYQDANSVSIKQVLADTCLLVLDHYSTPFSEALATSTPTIIFSPPRLYSEKAEKVLFYLRQCGIWHDTAESAAKFYMELVGKAPTWRDAEKDILDWWQSPHVRKARDAFCQGFAQTDPAWPRIWQSAFDELCL